jgi:hypothetical protein
MNGRTALAARPSRLGRLAVVGEGSEPPGWVHDWCRRDGRRLRTYRVPTTAPGHQANPVRLLTTIGPLTGDPVLVVPAGSTDTAPHQVTASLHDLPADGPVLAAAADSARFLGRPLVLVHGLPASFAERSVGLTHALEHGRGLLDAAARQLAADAPGLPVVTRLVRAHPHELVGEELGIGLLLVIGGPRRNVPDDLGLVACTAVQHATCPVLIVPR